MTFFAIYFCIFYTKCHTLQSEYFCARISKKQNGWYSIMYQIDFNKKQHVHFIGIGGISMSALAEILLNKGFTVSGSDSKESELTQRLTTLGAHIIYEQTEKNITPDISVVVYTAAIKEDNPELKAAKDQSVPTLTRAELLGEIMKNYNKAIGVSGTHGKTTTTSMISQVMLEEEKEKDPTILVGGIFNPINGNARIGNSDLFITEACEYTNSFLSFFPTIAVILNVREDHMDFFKDIDDIRNSFRQYAELVPENGYVVINSSIPDPDYITGKCKGNIVTFGLDKTSCDYSADNITYNEFGCAGYDLIVKGNKAIHIDLKVPGEHNVLNSLATVATCVCAGFSIETIKSGLEKYAGADRRFQYKGKVNGINIIDDYAHHPDEIEATLTAAKNYPHKDIWCVFQPHTFTRTKAFMKEFAKALSLADKVILADIYPARETDNLGISSETLLNELKTLGCEAYYFPSFDEIEKFILEKCMNDDMLITMGAGDVVLIGDDLISK